MAVALELVARPRLCTPFGLPPSCMGTYHEYRSTCNASTPLLVLTLDTGAGACRPALPPRSAKRSSGIAAPYGHMAPGDVISLSTKEIRRRCRTAARCLVTRRDGEQQQPCRLIRTGYRTTSSARCQRRGRGPMCARAHMDTGQESARSAPPDPIVPRCDGTSTTSFPTAPRCGATIRMRRSVTGVGTARSRGVSGHHRCAENALTDLRGRLGGCGFGAQVSCGEASAWSLAAAATSGRDERQADGGRQVALAGTGRADEDQVGAFVEPAIAGAEGHHVRRQASRGNN